MNNASITRQFLPGIIKSVLGRYSYYAIQLVALMIYARLFTPEQFGIIAGIQVFIVFFQLLGEVGLAPAIINKRTLTSEDRDGIFSWSVIIGTVIAILFLISLPAANFVYQREDYTHIGLPILIAIFFNALNAVPIGLNQRESRFLHLSASDVIAEVVALVIVSGIALRFQSFTILLSVRFAVLGIVKFCINMYWSRTTEFGCPKPGKKLSAIRDIIEMVRYQFLFNFVNFFSRNSDNLLVGRYIGMNPLGVYEKSYALMRYPLQLLTFALTPAIQPIIANNSNDKIAIVVAHNQLARILFASATIIAIGIHALSDEFVFVMLGEQWNEVPPILMAFSFMIPIQVLLSSSGSFFLGLNQPKLMFKAGIFSAITNVIAIIVGVYSANLVFLACALVVSFHVNAIQCYFLLYNKALNSSFLLLPKHLLPGISLFCLYLALDFLFLQQLDNQFSYWLTAFFKFSSVVLLSFIVLYFSGDLSRIVKGLRKQ